MSVDVTNTTVNLFSAPASADPSIFERWGALPKMLRLFWLWAKQRGADSCRGTVYLARDAVETILGVSSRTVRRCIAALERMGWVRPVVTTDHMGLEVRGLEVALGVEHGFCDGHDVPQIDRVVPQIDRGLAAATSIKKNETKRSKGQPETEDPRQSSLFDLDEVAPPLPPEGPDPEDKRSQREAAERLAAYERKRYAEHPRCQRRKREDPKSIARTVRAIVKVLDSGITEIECRAAIELQWQRCTQNADSWAYWTGTRFWEGQKLVVLLGWLEEQGNAECWAIARGEKPAPTAGPREPERKEPAALQEWKARTEGYTPDFGGLWFRASDRVGRQATRQDEIEQLALEAKSAGCDVALVHAAACMDALDMVQR